jgi:hypothetical protein
VLAFADSKLRDVKRVLLSWIGKLNITELDCIPLIDSVMPVKRNRISSIGHFCSQSKRKLHLPHAGKSLLASRVQFCGPAERLKKLRNKSVEGHQATHAQCASEHPKSSTANHRAQCQGNCQRTQDRKPSTGLKQFCLGTHCMSQELECFSFLSFFLTEELNGNHLAWSGFLEEHLASVRIKLGPDGKIWTSIFNVQL